MFMYMLILKYDQRNLNEWHGVYLICVLYRLFQHQSHSTYWAGSLACWASGERGLCDGQWQCVLCQLIRLTLLSQSHAVQVFNGLGCLCFIFLMFDSWFPVLNYSIQVKDTLYATILHVCHSYKNSILTPYITRLRCL